MKGSKVFVMLAGILLAILLLGGIACAFAGLLMLVWNVLCVAALSIAVPLTFITALKGVGIIYGVLAFVNIIHIVIRSYSQTLQVQAMTKMQEKNKLQEDILGYFRTN